jgi:hypothetical protein
MRQLRKFAALNAFLAVLPEELAGQVAPYDVRLAQPDERYVPANERLPQPLEVVGAPGQRNAAAPERSEDTALDAPAVATLYAYVLSATVQLALEQRKRELIAAINARLPYPLIEDLRFEQAGAQRIARQLNILATSPD